MTVWSWETARQIQAEQDSRNGAAEVDQAIAAGFIGPAEQLERQQRTDQLLAGLRTGDWLDRQDFPPLRFAVPGLVPEGLTLLVGPPKVGKSWLVLDLLLAVAAGGVALGHIRTGQPRRVLGLALEDGDRRQQDRCRELLQGDPIPGLYTYLTRVPPGLVLDTLDAYLDRYGDTALVVIDTLGRVLPPAMPQETTYQRDYRVGGRLKAIADSRPGLALVVVHHDRKAGADDFVDRVSGTNGLAGAADSVVVLSRERQSPEGLIEVTGRDIPEAEYALTVTGGGWTLDGHDLAAAARRASERKATAGVSDRSAEVIRLVADHPDGISPAAVAAKLGEDPTQIRVYLGRLVKAGRIGKAGRGLYVPVTSVTSLHPNQDQCNEVTDVTPSTGGGEWPPEPGVPAPCPECGYGLGDERHGQTCLGTEADPLKRQQEEA